MKQKLLEAVIPSIVVILVLIIALVILVLLFDWKIIGIDAGIQAVPPTPVQATAYVIVPENDPGYIMVITATPQPSALYPTYEPIATKADFSTESSSPDWMQADTYYAPVTQWRNQTTITGPAVVEWWNQQGVGNFSYEGFFFLNEGETVTMPSGYVGSWWEIPAGNNAIHNLEVSFRHLLYYKDKPEHTYMDVWLVENGLGLCNFDDQTGCSNLQAQILHLPPGVSIN